jgi:hypothetical protein
MHSLLKPSVGLLLSLLTLTPAFASGSIEKVPIVRHGSVGGPYRHRLKRKGKLIIVDSSPAARPLLTRDFKNCELSYVVKVLAMEMGRPLYLGPGVGGKVTVSLRAVPADAALARVLKMQGGLRSEILRSGVLAVVGSELIRRRKFHTPGSQLQEFTLAVAPRQTVVSYLRRRYPDATFEPAIEVDRFDAQARPSELKLIASEISDLDRLVSPLLRVDVPVDGDASGTCALLRTMVFNVIIVVAKKPGFITVEGSSDAVEQVKELIETPYEDRSVIVQCQLIALSRDALLSLGQTWFPDSPISSMSGDRPSNGSPPAFYTDSARNRLTELVSAGRARILASPRISVPDGDTCHLNIDHQTPKNSRSALRGQATGIELTAKVQSQPHNYIRVNLETRLQLPVNLTDPERLGWIRREASYDLSVKDAKTFMIPGLVSGFELRESSQIPFVMNLPVWGQVARMALALPGPSEVWLAVTLRKRWD